MDDQRLVASQRLAVLQKHLADKPNTNVSTHPTSAAEPNDKDAYSVVLPETLSHQGPWLVRR